MFKNSKLAFQSTSQGYKGTAPVRRTTRTPPTPATTHTPVRGVTGSQAHSTSSQVPNHTTSLFIALAGRSGVHYTYGQARGVTKRKPLADTSVLEVVEDGTTFKIHYGNTLHIQETNNQGTTEYYLENGVLYKDGVALGLTDRYLPLADGSNRVWNFTASYLGIHPTPEIRYNYLVLAQDLNLNSTVGLEELANLGYSTTLTNMGTANALNTELVSTVANSLIKGITSVQGFYTDTPTSKLLYRVYAEEPGIRVDKGVIKHASYAFYRSHDYTGYLFKIQLRGHRTCTIAIKQDVRGRLRVVLPDELYTPSGKIRTAYTLEKRIADQLVKILGFGR